ncbi:KAP family P-loop NTPase fold protein [Paenibacillus naphthalenovorans]|uniref:KAP family P-loop NTPase fold protein n=1 Tax=Paenibacillus naphthalenovorans TaxID=162209 RepID=UPI000942A1CF|nr:P-loop NTPase fold protein [Paenibacillus naphthalenovorans]
MPTSEKIMPSILDKEIDSTEADAFGHRHFAKALQDIIESPKNRPPFTLGLLGKWGVGKSSIKTLYLSSFNELGGSVRKQKVFPITFNAWRYGGENIKRALLRHVFLSLGGDDTLLSDALFRQIQRVQAEKKTWRNTLHEIFDIWGWGIVQILLVIIIFFATPLFIISRYFDFSNEWAVLALIGILASGNVGIIKYLFDPKNFIVRRYSNVTKIEAPSSTAEQYEDLLLAQLNNFKSGKTSIKFGKTCERIVVFVDDLDRLSSDEMINGLDAIRSFMDIPIPQDIGIIFVISCDEERVAEALAGRKRDKSSDLPGTIFNRMDARRFLDRIFQFRLEIPQFPKRDMRNYAMKKMTEELPELIADLEQKNVHFESLINRMIHVGVQSPRNCLQIINAFAHSWWIAKQREKEGAGTDRPGGLQEGAVTDHPISLGVLSALKVDFPDFYSDLQNDSELIGRFMNVVIRQLPIDDQPEAAQIVLKKYYNVEQKTIKNEYRMLRQFLASLQGLHWPSSLQPLLLLTQDPRTRKLGDKAQAIFDGFVSGDYQGVVADLGRDKDTALLSTDDAVMLQELLDEVNSDVEDRKDNGALVIAKLLPRFPNLNRKAVSISLARRLVESPGLRWRIGVSKIGEVLSEALPPERKALAGKLIQDLLRIESDISWRLESGERPSINEAVEIVKDACLLILGVRKIDGLYSSDDKLFLEWLEVRSITIGKENYEFPINILETWMDEHEEHLLFDLGVRYIELLLARIKVNKLDDIDIEKVLVRFNKLFQRLRDSGEESRSELWRLLADFVSVKVEAFVKISWEIIVNSFSIIDKQSLGLFLEKFSERLNKDMDDKDWQLEGWEEAGIALLKVLEEMKKQISELNFQNLISLCNKWSVEEVTGKYAVLLLDILFKVNQTKAQEILKVWSDSILTELTNECVKWLGQNYSKLSSDVKNTLNTHIAQVHSRGTNEVTKEEANQYKLFMDSLNKEDVNSDLINQHLQQVYSRMTQNYNNPNNYLYRILPAVITKIQQVPKNIVGQMIYTLFANTKGQTSLYGWLHLKFAQYWPKQEPEYTNYNPQQIFNEAKAFLDNYSSTDKSYGCLRSMRNMIKRGIVGEDSTNLLMDAASKVWNSHREDAVETFLDFTQLPTPTVLCNLADSVVEDDKEALLRVWKHAASHAKNDYIYEMSNRILAKQPVNWKSEADVTLTLWISVLSDPAQFLYKLVTDNSLNTDQRKRAWAQIKKSYRLLGADFFLKHLKDIVASYQDIEGIRDILKSDSIINELFPSVKEKNLLSIVLLECFIMVDSIELKNSFALWIQKNGGSSILGKLKELADPSDDDLEVLKQHFPDSKKLAKFIS